MKSSAPGRLLVFMGMGTDSSPIEGSRTCPVESKRFRFDPAMIWGLEDEWNHEKSVIFLLWFTRV